MAHFILGAFSACFFGGLALLGWQAFQFLKYGAWPPISATAGLYYVTGIEWFASPSSWYGIHAVLEALNAGAALLITAFATVLVLAASD